MDSTPVGILALKKKKKESLLFETIHSSIHFSICSKDLKCCDDKSDGAMSGEYGGWGKTSQFMSCIYFSTGSAICERALSWSKISLSWRVACSGRFFSMLGSVSSIVIYSEQPWSFHPVSATHGIPYLLNPT